MKVRTIQTHKENAKQEVPFHDILIELVSLNRSISKNQLQVRERIKDARSNDILICHAPVAGRV